MFFRKYQTKHHILIGLVVLILAVIIAAISSALYLREREIESWSHQLSDLSLLLAEQTNQTMESAQLAMDSITDRINSLKSVNEGDLISKVRSESFHQVLRDKITGLPQVDVATVVAANGDVVNFTRSYPPPSINLSDRDYFQARLHDDSIGLFISNPVRNRGNGKWVFYLSRRLNDASGKFMGMVLVGISVDHFTNFFQQLCTNLGEAAAITLYRRDYTVLTRYPLKDELIGKKNLSGTTYEVIEAMKRKDAVIFSSGPRFSDAGIKVARLGAVRELERFPMIVNLTVNEDLFLANWHHTALSIAAIASGSIITILIATFFLLRAIRQQEISAKMLHELSDQVPGMLFQFKLSPDGHFSFPYVNKEVEKSYGVSAEQLRIDASKLFDYQHPEDKEEFIASIQESANKLVPWHKDYRMVPPGKGVTWRHGDALPQKLNDGGVLWHGYIADITDRKHTEQELQRESEKNLALLRNASDGIHILDTNGNIIEVSYSFCSMLGYQRDEMIGMNVSQWDAQFSEEQIPQIVSEQFNKQGRSQFETRHRCKDGSIIEVEVSGYPLELDGKPVLFNSSRDITDRKKMEAALQEQLSFSTALNKISKILVEKEDLKLILQDIVHVVGETLGIDRALIYDINFGKKQIIGMSQWLNPNYPNITSSIATYPLDVFLNGVTEISKSKSWLISHHNNINPHLLLDGSGEMLHKKLMIKTLLWYPFAFHEDEYYLLVLNQLHSRREWTKEETSFLDSVSHMSSVELEKNRLMEERKQVANDLRIAATSFEVHEGILVTDEKYIILRVNTMFSKITGYKAEEVIGKTPHILSSGRHDVAFYDAMWERINEYGAWEGEIWNRRKSGEIYPEHLTITAVKDLNGTVTNYVAAFADITKHKMAEDEIKNLAFYDPLTHLPNRRLLLDRLQQALATSDRSGKQGSLLFIDLDNFKSLNDSLGHDIGDMLLQQVAQRLESCVREGDTVARLGGDEFVVMLEDLSELPLETAAQTELVGNKILNSLNQIYQLGIHLHHSTPSIGATLFNKQQSMDELLKQADIAMYQAKKAGRNTLRFFDPEMQHLIDQRMSLEAEMRKAIDRHQFQLYFQIQVDHNQRPIGAEALIRWIHPERGMVSPADFIPIAEEIGLIFPIGWWVLDTACAQIKSWQKAPHTSNLILSINVSARQFHHVDFSDQVQAVLNHHQINPKLLKLELTESMLLEDINETISKMYALKDIGVGFSLDDFGTGYSSLQYLKRLPLDQLKIDQSFVRDLTFDMSDKAIVNTVIAMAHSLNLNVIAEGVETDEQQQILLSMDCTNFQGYLFSKPLPIDKFEELIKQSKSH